MSCPGRGRNVEIHDVEPGGCMFGQPEGSRGRSLQGASVIAIVMTASSLAATPQPVAEVPCVEPHPCGYVWEGAGLGPFELDRIQEVWVDSQDGRGTQLHGWIAFPDLPQGVPAPVALHSSPYLGWCPDVVLCVPSPGEAAFWADEPGAAVVRTWGVPPIELVRHGYAAAFFELRGTGQSGGCLDTGGPDETHDQAVLVDWLADQEWFNGRVGMGGNSYPGQTPWQAAIEAPEGLKTIVTAGITSDMYTAVHSPQGAAYELTAPLSASWDLAVTWTPHAGAGEDPTRDLTTIAGRVAAPCQPFAEATELVAGGFVRDRDPDYWEPRRYIDRFNQVQASVLLAHGLWDATYHAFQDLLVWEALQGTRPRPPGLDSRPPAVPCPPAAPFCADAPKAPPMWQISGQWFHGPPFAEQPALTPEWIRDNWHAMLFDWLGHWLQGLGDTPPHRVDYQDSSGQWHTSSAWPPAEARDEALYLDGDRLTAAPGGSDRRFRAAPSPANSHSTFWVEDRAGGGPWMAPPAVWSWCRQELLADPRPDTGIAYVSQPFATDSLLAGNPVAHLELSSDQPGGIVEVTLVRWPQGATCTDPPAVPDVVARGTADLRYHHGGYDARPFAVDTPTAVRVDLFNNAVRFAPGDRLVVSVSGPEKPGDFGATSPFNPEVTVHAGRSHVVVPFVSGGLGGQPTDLHYPPSPAAPRGR